MRVPLDLQQFRHEFVKNFHRISMNTTPGDAEFLRILIESARAKNGLEIGVATGYGALVMGLGFERNKGHLTSIDIDTEMIATARANIRKMQLHKTVTVVKGAASTTAWAVRLRIYRRFEEGVSRLSSGRGTEAEAQGRNRGG